MKHISRVKGKRKMWILIAVVVLLTVTVCVILPPSLGKTKPFLDDMGNVIEGSISEKLSIDINGDSISMFLMAEDESKPVLLFLGGGPGIPEYFLEYNYPTGIEKEFVVCYMEYRGTSLSYNADIPIDTMTTEQFVSDVVAVTGYLSERFSQEKIYLMGHSFGTYVGIKTASQNPELYHAYIAMSQITDQVESEHTAYSYMLEQYRAAGNTKMVEKFEDCPILTSDEAYQRYFTSSLRDTAMHDLRVGTMRNMDSVVTGIFFPSLRCTVYTPMERINIWRGKSFAQTTPVVDDSTHFIAFEEIPRIDIPIYFFAGIHDYTCCYSLQKEYFEFMQAPVKGFYTFGNSAHSPIFEESERAVAILSIDVLQGTNTLADR